MNYLTPRTATEALRLAKTMEAVAKLELDMFWAGDGTATVYSWKMDETGKRVKSRYEVDLNKWTCTCADFSGRGHYCKHLLKCREVEEETLQMDLMEDMEDGKAFMENFHTERSL
jgi:hypothetical protein